MGERAGALDAGPEAAGILRCQDLRSRSGDSVDAGNPATLDVEASPPRLESLDPSEGLSGLLSFGRERQV